jgi:cytochrome b561
MAGKSATAEAAGRRYGLAQIVLHWVVVLLVAEQSATSGAMLRIHAYRPLGKAPDPFDLTLNLVHARVGLLMFVLVALRLVLRVIRRAPEWLRPLPPWRRRVSASVQYALYATLLGQAATGPLPFTCGGRSAWRTKRYSARSSS